MSVRLRTGLVTQKEVDNHEEKMTFLYSQLNFEDTGGYENATRGLTEDQLLRFCYAGDVILKAETTGHKNEREQI